MSAEFSDGRRLTEYDFPRTWTVTQEMLQEAARRIPEGYALCGDVRCFVLDIQREGNGVVDIQASDWGPAVAPLVHGVLVLAAVTVKAELWGYPAHGMNHWIQKTRVPLFKAFNAGSRLRVWPGQARRGEAGVWPFTNMAPEDQARR